MTPAPPNDPADSWPVSVNATGYTTLSTAEIADERTLRFLFGDEIVDLAERAAGDFTAAEE